VGRKRKKKASSKPVETDPDKLAVVLLAYAYRYAASRGWDTRARALARGQGVEDIVQDALASLYGGEPDRRWDPQKHPDPMTHLRSFVNSRLSTLARSYDNRRVAQGIDAERHANPNNPEDLVMVKQQQEAEEAWWENAKDLLLTEILGDDLLVAIHDIMEKEEIEKPAELASRLGVPVEDIKNAKKRFRRAWVRVVGAVGRPPSHEGGGHS